MKIPSIAAASILIGSLAGEQMRYALAFAPSFGKQRLKKQAISNSDALTSTTTLYKELPREMSQMGFVHDDPSVHRKKRDQSSLLSAVAIDTPVSWESGLEVESLWSNIQPILSTALLVTGNTVGASCLVLPEMAARPGMAVSTALFFGMS